MHGAFKSVWQQRLSIWLWVCLIVKSRHHTSETDLPIESIDGCRDLVDQVTEIPKLTCNDKRLIEFRIPSEIRAEPDNVGNGANDAQGQEIYTIEMPTSSDGVAKLSSKDEFSRQLQLNPKIDLGKHCDSGDEFSIFLQRKKNLATVAAGLSSNGNFIASKELNDIDKSDWSKQDFYFLESTKDHKTLDEIERAVCEMKASKSPFTWTCLFESERVLLRVQTPDNTPARFTLIRFNNKQPITNHGIVILQRENRPLQFSSLCDAESQSNIDSGADYFKIIYTNDIFDDKCRVNIPSIDELVSIVDLKDVKYILGFDIPYMATLDKCLSAYQGQGETIESIIRPISLETADLQTKQIKIRIIVIIVAASAVGFVALVSGMVFCLKKRKKNKTDRRDNEYFDNPGNRDYSLNEDKSKGIEKSNRNDNDAYDDGSIKNANDNHQPKIDKGKAQSRDDGAYDSIQLGINEIPKGNLKAVKKAEKRIIQEPKKPLQENSQYDDYGTCVMNPPKANLKAVKKADKKNIQVPKKPLQEDSQYDDYGTCVMNPPKANLKAVKKLEKRNNQEPKKQLQENSQYDDVGISVMNPPKANLKAVKKAEKRIIQEPKKPLQENSQYDDIGISVMNPPKANLKAVKKADKKNIQGPKMPSQEISEYDDYGTCVMNPPKAKLKAVKTTDKKNIQGPKKPSQEFSEYDDNWACAENSPKAKLKAVKTAEKGNIQGPKKPSRDSNEYDDNWACVENLPKG